MNFGRDALGMSRRENRTTGFVTWDIKGRLLLDAWLSVKKELRPKREGLGYVSSSCSTTPRITSILLRWTMSGRTGRTK